MADSNYDFARATFHFFIVLRQRPGAVVWLGVWQALAYTALVALILLALWPLFSVIIAAEQAGRDPNEAELLAVLGSVWLTASLSILGAILISLMVQAAWLRLLTHGRTARVIPLRLGLDELRLLGVNLCFILFVSIGYLVMAVITGMVIGASVLGFEADPAAGVLGAGLGVVFIVAIVLVAVFFMLRFAAAPAMSVNEGRFRLFGSFAATKGVWGWMLLSYIVLYVLILMAASLVSGLQFGAVLIAAADGWGVIEDLGAHPNPADLTQLFASPSFLVALLILIGSQMVLQILIEGSWHGVGAYVAVRHGGQGDAPEPIVTPTASVGAAPGEG